MVRTSSQTLQTRHLLLHAGGIVAAMLLAGGTWKASTGLCERQAHLHNELRTVEDLASRDHEIRAKHERLAKEIQSLQNAADSLICTNARTPNDAELLAEFSKLAVSDRLSIKSYSPGHSSTNCLEAQISATASYAGVCQFLDGLSSISFLCEVTQCSIAAPQQGNGPCALELTVRVMNPKQIDASLTAAGGKR